MKKYIVYKTIGPHNLYYIGVHCVNNGNLEDGYIGCGINKKPSKPSNRTSSKFGLAVFLTGYKNWSRQILFSFDNPLAAYQKEAELVTMKTLKDPLCLNTVVGGKSENYEAYKLSYIALFNNNGSLYKIFENKYEAAYKLGMHTAAFSKKNRLKRLISGQYRFEFFTDKEDVPCSIKPLGR